MLEKKEIHSKTQINYAGNLGVILAVYCIASLIHFVHNAVFIGDYPNLPSWITTPSVYMVWLGISSIGITGYLLFKNGKIYSGLLLCAIYGAIGLDGLAHYSLALPSEHTYIMNLTIWLEAITGTVVALYVIRLMVKYYKSQSQQILL